MNIAEGRFYILQDIPNNMVFEKGHPVYSGSEKGWFEKEKPSWNKGIEHNAIKGNKHPLWKGGLPICKCGKILSTRKSKFCNNCKGEYISSLTKGKVNIGRKKQGGYTFPKGKEHPNWVGGISKVTNYRKLTSKSEWRRQREEILKEKGKICNICKKYGDCIDHIVPWRIDKNNNKSNLQVLCRSCNSKKVKGDKKKWSQ